MKARSRNITYENGSENVFADLGFENAAEELAKAKLVRAICGIVTRRKLKQTEAAAVLGIPQPKASLLLRGRTAGFSTERLMRFLNRLDQDVEISVKPKRHNVPTYLVRAVPMLAAIAAEGRSVPYGVGKLVTRYASKRAARRTVKYRRQVIRKRK